MSSILDTTTVENYGILVISKSGEEVQHMSRVGDSMEEVEAFRVKLAEYDSNKDSTFHLVKSLTTVTYKIMK